MRNAEIIMQNAEILGFYLLFLHSAFCIIILKRITVKNV